MAGEKRTEAYDLSMFDSSEAAQMSGSDKKSKKKKKSGKIISISQGSSAKAQRRKRNPITIATVAILTIIVSAVAIMMVQNYANLNEINEQITAKNKEYSVLQNEQAQYQLKIDSKLTDTFVKSYAETKLDMVPAKKAQKKFISLSNGDKGEVLGSGKDNSVFDTIIEAFSGAFL